MRGRSLPALFLLLLAGMAAAAGPTHVESEHGATLQGEVAFSYPGGVGFVESWMPAEVRLTNVSGTATLYTWREAHAGGVWSATERAQPTTIPLEGATIVVRAAGETPYAAWVVPAAGGVVGVTGAHPTLEARPMWLSQGYERHPTPSISPFDPPTLEVVAPPGWSAIGEIVGATHEPRPETPRFFATGAFLAELDGSVATILHGNGTVEEHALAAVSDAPSAAGVEVLRHERNLFVDADVGSLEAPAAGYWLVAGPAPVWSIEGTADWARASGSDGATSFEDEPVHIEGTFDLRPDPSRAGDLDADRFEVAGDYTLSTSGVTLTSTPAPAVAALPAWTIWTALGAVMAFFASPHLAGRLVAPFYTRIAPTEIATHPARALICQQLTQAPGVHVRDLHRRVGGAWGTFSFHLGMLRQAGAVRFERDGRYVAVYLSHQAGANAAPRTATAQRVLEALPEDGAPLVVTKLRDQTGLSRQLLDHHLAALAQQGLVHVDEARPRRVSRQVLR